MPKSIYISTTLFCRPRKGKACVFWCPCNLSHSGSSFCSFSFVSPAESRTALRVRRRPVEDRASATRHGGSASGIPPARFKKFPSREHKRPAPRRKSTAGPLHLSLPALTEISLTLAHLIKSMRCVSPCAPRAGARVAWGESTPASGGALIMLRLKTHPLA